MCDDCGSPASEVAAQLIEAQRLVLKPPHSPVPTAGTSWGSGSATRRSSASLAGSTTAWAFLLFERLGSAKPMQPMAVEGIGDAGARHSLVPDYGQANVSSVGVSECPSAQYLSMTLPIPD